MLHPPLQPPTAPRPPPRWTLERVEWRGPFQTSSRAHSVRICSPEGTHSPRNQARSPLSLETPIPPGHCARGIPAPEACEPRPSALGTLGLRPSAAGRHSGPKASRCPRPQLLSDGGRATAHWPRPGLRQAVWMTRAGQTNESPASGARAQACPAGCGPLGAPGGPGALRTYTGRTELAHAQCVGRITSENSARVQQLVIKRSWNILSDPVSASEGVLRE